MPRESFPWADVCRDVAARSAGKFLPAADEAQFSPAKRREIISKMFPPDWPIVPPDVETIVGLLKDQVASLAPQVDFVIGVHRKGMSILREIDFRLSLPKEKVLEDEVALARDLRGKRILVVDDSIHRGDTACTLIARLREKGAGEIIVCCLVASSDGVEIVKTKHALTQVHHQLVVPEEEFGGQWALRITPVLGGARGGAIVNRPHIGLSVRAPQENVIAWAKDFLTALAGLKLTETLEETPILDGIACQVFKGTLQPSSRMFELVKGQASKEELDQLKFRVFVSPENPMMVHLYAVIWPNIDSAKVKDISKWEKEIAATTLESLEKELKEALAQKGYSVERMPAALSSSL